MKLSVQINEGPYQHQATDTAYHFTKAALENGHEVMRVFFYHDGVLNGTRLTTPPQDDRHIVNRWVELAEKYNLDLVLCVAAAQRRGLVDDGEAERNKRTQPISKSLSASRVWVSLLKPLSRAIVWLSLAIKEKYDV